MRIIDTHVHVFERLTGYGFTGGFRPIGNGLATMDVGMTAPIWPAEFGDKGVLAEDFVKFMDENGIEKACIMQGPAYGIHNYYLKEVMEKYPDRFLGAAFVDPEILFFKEVLGNLVFNLGFRLFKIEMSTMGGIMGCHSSNSMMNPNIDLLFETLNGVNGTVSLDIGGPAEPSYQVDRVLELAKKNPNVKVVFCHLFEPDKNDFEGFCRTVEKAKLENVYTEISSLPNVLEDQPPYELTKKFMRKAVETLGADHVMWGSDAPGALLKCDYQTVLKALVLENESLTEDEKELIAYKNAEKVYPF